MFSLWLWVEQKQMGCGDSPRACAYIQPVHSTDQPADTTHQAELSGGREEWGAAAKIDTEIPPLIEKPTRHGLTAQGTEIYCPVIAIAVLFFNIEDLFAAERGVQFGGPSGGDGRPC